MTGISGDDEAAHAQRLQRRQQGRFRGAELALYFLQFLTVRFGGHQRMFPQGALVVRGKFLRVAIFDDRPNRRD